MLNKKRMIAITILAALAWAVYALLETSSRQDRPPIIVQDGSLDFSTTYAWSEDRFFSEWKPEQPEGKSTNHFEITVTGGTCTANPMTGTKLELTYTLKTGAEHTFKIKIRRHTWTWKNEPKVETPVAFDNSTPTLLRYAEAGDLMRLKVTGGGREESCEFAVDDHPLINVQPR